jgi:chitinase
MARADSTTICTAGVWDRDNPIGSIVQGHTNLTEIKLAAELFWRVGVPPAKIMMGFGFYGRVSALKVVLR